MKPIKCSSCGSALKNIEKTNFIKCQFCGNEFLFPYSQNKTGGNNKNLIINIEEAIKSKNYDHALKFCKKAIENDFKNSLIWELNSKCLRGDQNKKLNFQVCEEILKSLKNSKKFGGTETLKNSIKNLTKDVYDNILSDYENLEYDFSKSGEVWDSFSKRSIQKVINFVKLSQICYDLLNDVDILKSLVYEISGHNKLFWIKDEKKNNSDWLIDFDINAAQLREDLISKIIKIDKNYKPPKEFLTRDNVKVLENKNCFVATVCFGSQDDQSVIILRKFRDEFLKKFKIGNHLIFWYYKNGSKIAIFIDNKFFLKLLIKKLILNPLVFIIKIFL